MSIATATIIGEVIEVDHLMHEAREILDRASAAIDHAIQLSNTGGYRVSQHEALLRFVIARQWGEMVRWRRALGDPDEFDDYSFEDAGAVLIQISLKAFMARLEWLSPVDEIRAWFGGGR